MKNRVHLYLSPKQIRHIQAVFDGDAKPSGDPEASTSILRSCAQALAYAHRRKSAEAETP